MPRLRASRRARSTHDIIAPLYLAPSPDLLMLDAHVHTRYSDGIATVREVEELCRRRGIGCCITDHNEIRGSIRLWERKRVSTLPAIETGSREQVELIVYFKDPESLERFYRFEVEPYRTRRWYAFLPRALDHLVSGAVEHGGFISMPHPYAPLWKNVEYGRKRRPAIWRALSAAEGIEVFNGGLSERSNHRALMLCDRLGRIPLGGSDCHDRERVGSVVVGLCRPERPAGLFAALSDGHVYGILAAEERPRSLSAAWRMIWKHSWRFVAASGESRRGFGG